jgi:hypothetical protein
MVGTRYHSNVLLSSATLPGDDSFATMTNVHTLHVLATIDFCPQVQLVLPHPEACATFEADSPAPGGSGVCHTPPAPSAVPIGGSRIRNPPGAPNVPRAMTRSSSGCVPGVFPSLVPSLQPPTATGALTAPMIGSLDSAVTQSPSTIVSCPLPRHEFVPQLSRGDLQSAQLLILVL